MSQIEKLQKVRKRRKLGNLSFWGRNHRFSLKKVTKSGLRGGAEFGTHVSKKKSKIFKTQISLVSWLFYQYFIPWTLSLTITGISQKCIKRLKKFWKVY
jgi:hypothetical protein